MHCISLAILSRLSQFPSPAVDTNWPFCGVDVPLNNQPTNIILCANMLFPWIESISKEACYSFSFPHETVTRINLFNSWLFIFNILLMPFSWWNFSNLFLNSKYCTKILNKVVCRFDFDGILFKPYLTEIAALYRHNFMNIVMPRRPRKCYLASSLFANNPPPEIAFNSGAVDRVASFTFSCSA